jgi:hypothetical protein
MAFSLGLCVGYGPGEPELQVTLRFRLPEEGRRSVYPGMGKASREAGLMGAVRKAGVPLKPCNLE